MNHPIYTDDIFFIYLIIIRNSTPNLKSFYPMTILQFLDEACDTSTLVQIRREVYGDVDNEDADDDDGDEVDDNAKVERQESKTLQSLLEKHNGECLKSSTDWTCFLDYLKQNFWMIAALDVDLFQTRLIQLRDITSYSHIIRSKSYRNNFSAVVNIAKEVRWQRGWKVCS